MPDCESQGLTFLLYGVSRLSWSQWTSPWYWYSIQGKDLLVLLTLPFLTDISEYTLLDYFSRLSCQHGTWSNVIMFVQKGTCRYHALARKIGIFHNHASGGNPASAFYKDFAWHFMFNWPFGIGKAMEISIHHKTFPTKTDIFLKGNALVATHLQNIRLKSLSDCDSPCFSYGQILSLEMTQASLNIMVPRMSSEIPLLG